MRVGGEEEEERALVWHLSSDVDRQLVEKVLLEFAKWNREAAAEAHTGTHRHAHTHTQAHRHTGTQAHTHIQESSRDVSDDGLLWITTDTACRFLVGTQISETKCDLRVSKVPRPSMGSIPGGFVESRFE